MRLRGKYSALLILGIGVGSFGFAADTSAQSESRVGDLDRLLEAAAQQATATASPNSPGFVRAYLDALDAIGAGPQSNSTEELQSLDRMFGTTVALDPRFRSSLELIAREKTVKIWGGKEAPSRNYLDVVAILGNGKICTGTLISPTSVLTARHCVCEGVHERVVSGSRIDQAIVEVPVERFDKFSKCHLDLAEGDLAVIHLARPLPDPPRPLVPIGWLSDPTSGRAIGFGRKIDPLDAMGSKRLVDLPVTSSSCSGFGSTSDADRYGCAPGRELVAGSPWLNKDTCVGDSGGPFLLRDSNGNGCLGAVTSRPIRNRRECGDGGVYVRIDRDVRAWLTRIGVDYTVGNSN